MAFTLDGIAMRDVEVAMVRLPMIVVKNHERVWVGLMIVAKHGQNGGLAVIVTKKVSVTVIAIATMAAMTGG